MTVIRNTASGLRQGRRGNETFYVSGSQQIVRVGQNSSNYGASASRTASQQGNRVRWANLVNFYKISLGWMPKAFESKKANQSDYNRFMQVNLAASKVALTKDQAAAGAVVVDTYIISQGSLRSISVHQAGNTWQTDIALGALSITDSTSVAEFSAAVIAANNWAHANQQISFISYQQYTDPLGYAKCICTAYEVTLDVNDSRSLRDLLPDFCSQKGANGCLATSDNISVGAFAYVLSETISGKCYVSTQLLINNNSVMVAQYTSAAQVLQAIESYGVQRDAFLDSGSGETSPAAQVPYISAMRDGTGDDYPAGESGIIATYLVGSSDARLILVNAADITATSGQCVVKTWNNKTFSGSASLATTEDNKKLFAVSSWSGSAGSSDYIKEVTLTLGGESFSIAFAKNIDFGE